MSSGFLKGYAIKVGIMTFYFELDVPHYGLDHYHWDFFCEPIRCLIHYLPRF